MFALFRKNVIFFVYIDHDHEGSAHVHRFAHLVLLKIKISLYVC